MRITKERIYFHTPYRTLLKNLDEITEKEISCEIYVDGNGLDASTKAEIGAINSAFDKYGLAKTIHGPFNDLNPGSRDPKARQLALERFAETLEFCKALKSNHIVLHTGLNPIYYKDALELFLGLSVEVWKKTLAAAAKDGITISLENSLEQSPFVIIELLKRVGTPNFRACFDIGHFNVFGEKSVFEYLKEYPPDSISELHLSDNKGDFDAHLALGEGRIDFEKFFREIGGMGIEPIITCEPHSKEDIDKNLKYLIALGNRLK